MKYFLLTLLSIFLLVLLALTTIMFSRPPRTNQQRELFQGVTYYRKAVQKPRPLMIHIVEIDLTAPGIKFLVTPGDSINAKELPLCKTSKFLTEFAVQLAINGAFYSPYQTRKSWFPGPNSGDSVNVIGLAISNGNKYSDDAPHWPVLCIDERQARICSNGCPPNTNQALAGDAIFIEEGLATDRQAKYHHNLPYSRTAVAVDPGERILWLIVVDGKQSYYSEGVTINEGDLDTLRKMYDSRKAEFVHGQLRRVVHFI
ncbi:MAG: phosphodiester glycosidase family protein, partial [Planctomycetes bacterium]|nr:phosphodiester glycosidase family protein [Planctomycetota bacterium]